MMQAQVALVTANTDSKLYESIFVRGQFVVGGCSDDSGIDYGHLANALALALGVKLDTFEVSDNGHCQDGFDWDDVHAGLQADGKLQGGMTKHTLTFSYMDHDGTKGTDSATFEAENMGHALEQLYSEVSGEERSVIALEGVDFDDSTIPWAVELDEGDFQMTPLAGNKIEVTVANRSVAIYQHEDCVEVEIYSMADLVGAPLTSFREYFS